MVANHRETVSGITHLIAAIFAVFGSIWLLAISANNPSQMLVLFLYGISLVAVFSASARLHLSRGTRDYKLKLRRHDHAAIYFVIAGTYTPLIVMLIDDTWQWITLAIIWGLCLFGMIWKLKLLDWHNNSFVSTGIYLLVGWFGALCAPLWIYQLDMFNLVLIVTGGIIYSIGAVIFALERPNLARHFGFHELWHILVMLASLLHFLAIARIVMTI